MRPEQRRFRRIVVVVAALAVCARLLLFAVWLLGAFERAARPEAAA